MRKNPKMVICRNCNTAMAENVKNCPACGAKNKKPFYKKWWFILLMLIIVAGAISSIGDRESKKENKNVQYTWPTSELANMIPQPESEYGKIRSESQKYFYIEIYAVTDDQFENYIDKCKESGFTEDYTRYESYYHAKNAEGYLLNLRYDIDAEDLTITLNAPVEEEESKQSESQVNPTEIPEKSTDASVVESADNKSSESNDDSNNSNLVNGMRPEFKEAMDAYEAFYNEYCDILKKYAANPTDITLLAKYTELVGRVNEMTAAFESWDESSMNDAELKYYLEVNSRVANKLLEVGRQ